MTGTKLWSIWSEGYRATGGSSRAYKLGEVSAETFQEACDKLCSPEHFQRKQGNYSPEHLTVWGCKLFDNEAEARKSYG